MIQEVSVSCGLEVFLVLTHGHAGVGGGDVWPGSVGGGATKPLKRLLV